MSTQTQVRGSLIDGGPCDESTLTQSSDRFLIRQT